MKFLENFGLMLLLIVLLTALIVTGCGGSDIHWTNGTGDQDRYETYDRAMKPVDVSAR